MEPILKTVAREYSSRYKNLSRICFLFPNKRCGLFLKRYLAELGIKSDGMPHILTITEFMSQVAKKTEAGYLEQIFSLFETYKALEPDNSKNNFESFNIWGDMVLSDFNIVDMYLVDPWEIFKNIRDYREITSNFLTEDQKEVMKEYFGVETGSDTSEFWKNFEKPLKEDSLKQKFLNLWQILGPLHEGFIARLDKLGKGTSGSIYRKATEALTENPDKGLPYNKIVAVGFNALTEAERRIFQILKKRKGVEGYDDYIDFIWDLTGAILNNKDVAASRFVSYNQKKFPSPEWFNVALNQLKEARFPKIKIISSPSLTAQTKIAGEILSQYSAPEKKKMISEAEVALVLPDETLLSNTLFSLPDNIGDINLTMGFSLRNSSVATFVSLLKRLYNTSREKDGSLIYYVKDLKRLFSHPFSYILFTTEKIEELQSYINTYHKVNLSLKEIDATISEAAEILKFPSKNGEGKEMSRHLHKVLDELICKLSNDEQKQEENQDISQIKIYDDYIKIFEENVERYNIAMSPLVALQMIERLVSASKIGFEGEPLMGLQVMGTLETRVLDFKDVVIMSMNEGIMPRKTFTSTFIPETLRKAYGLPPARYAEEIFGYYFFRLISRAENVTLIYDGRTGGNSGGESRYLLQLRHFVPEEFLTEEIWQFRMHNQKSKEEKIEKTEEIRELIQNFTPSGKLTKNFSASSLNTYRECQVRFFLQNVLNLKTDPEAGEYLDAITIGDVLHQVMMEIYLPDENEQKILLKQPKRITEKFLSEILENENLIKGKVNKAIRQIYYKTEEPGSIKSGVNEIIADQIIELVKAILEYDRGLTPFNLLGCEISRNLKLELSSGRIVNFRFAIDRLDSIDIDCKSCLRIVDYKTGRRKRKADSIVQMFEGGNSSEQIFQLFTYAWILGKLGIEGWEDVITEIYYVPDLISGKGGYPEINKEKILSFCPYIQEFSEKVEDMIESVFSDPYFIQSKDTFNCTYCAFKSFCDK